MSEVLVERDGELAALEAALASAGDGRGETLMLEGEAGIGKSSLLAVATVAACDAGDEGACVELDRRGVAPPMLELGPDPDISLPV